MRKARPGSSGRFAFPLVLLALLIGITGCSRDEASYEPNADDSELRIVSFMPSATRIVVDLGLGDRIVGVAEHDAAAPPINADGDPMPIVGHFMDVDTEKLLALQPTHVIFPETTSASLADIGELGLHIQNLKYPTRIKEVIESIQVIGRFVEHTELSDALTQEIELWYRQRRADLDAVSATLLAHYGGDGNPRPALPKWHGLLVFSVDPVVASGPGSINDELIYLALGKNSLADASVSAVTLDREALITANPEVIVLLLPGATEAEAEEKVAWFDGLPIAAVEDGRVNALTDPQVLLPATNLPEVWEDLMGAIFGRIPADHPADLGEPKVEQ